MKNNVRIRLIEPAGKPSAEALERSIRLMQTRGFTVLYEPVAASSDYPLYAAADADRAEQFYQAMTETESDIVIATRGGYGASALLRRIDWDAIRSSAPKLLIGFSDISALHCALLTQTGRVGLHAGMPGSKLFCQPGDVTTPLIDLLTRELPWSSQLVVDAREQLSKNISGWLFGGNLAVLSGLIGTPWFPSDLEGSIVFLEEVGENGGRIARYFDQWVESGATRGVQALVLGALTNTGPGPAGLRANIIAEIERRADFPVYVTEQIGHCAPNLPIPTGANATIEANSDRTTCTLRWQLQSLNASTATT